MIKLQDFANQQSVTDRQVQRLLKKYESELDGLFERHGHNGTWLTDEACEILRSKMKQQPVVVSDTDPQSEQLKKLVKELREQLDEKDDRIKEKDKAMERLINLNIALQEQNCRLIEANKQIFLLQSDNERTKKEAENARLIAEEEKNRATVAEKEKKKAEIRASEAERKEKEISFLLTETKEQLQTTEEVAKSYEQERDQERQRAEAAEQEASALKEQNDLLWTRLEEVNKKSFFRRISDKIEKFFSD